MTSATHALTVQEPKNFETLQCGRGLAALAIVFFHANLTLALPKYIGRETAHVFSCGFSGIYYFFVLSGAVMVLAHWDQLGRRQSAWSFYLKRFKRIYLPLWPVLVLLIPIVIRQISLNDVVLAFSALPSRSDPILAVEWTLRHEILFYTLFGLVLWRPALGTIALALWLAGSVLTAIVPLIFPVSFLLSPLHLLFAVGMLSAFAIKRRIPYPPVLAGSGILMFGLAVYNQSHGITLFSMPNVAWYAIGSLFLITGFARLEVTHGLITPTRLRALGDASYSLYLVHFPIVSVCSKLATALNTRVNLPVTTYFILTVIISIVGGFLFYRMVELPVTNWARTRSFALAS